ncbi:MAG: ABC transporter substrate-binding protein [Dehalococcoidia bacterium]|nr:ABC transporter substrate-binding protein [Dehalococcoidia bacterium]
MNLRLMPGTVVLALLGTLALAACAPAAPATPTPAPKTAAAVPTATSQPVATASASTPTPKPEKVKMATPSVGLVEMAQQIANKKGFFAEENIEAEITRVAPDVSVKALVGGQIDFVFALGSVMRAAAQGVQVKGVMATISKPYHVLVVRPEITEGKALKGKNFGVASPEDSPTQMIRAALRYYGLDPEKDATITTIGGNPERLAGLKGGIIQGTVLEPLYAIKSENEGMRQLLKMSDIMDMPLAGLGASDKMIKERPDVILRVVRATAKGLKYIKDPKNKDEMVEYMVKELNATPAEAKATYSDITKTFSEDGDVPEDAINQEVKQAISQAGAKPTTTVADVFDYSFIKRVKEGR